MRPRVSVHLPSYQQRDYLRAAIESVLAQEYDNLEIVVGDDGSTDGTHEMLREYEGRYPGLFVLALSTVNRGTTANWNQILPRCTGEYVAWLDGDDLWLPGKLHKQVEYLEAHPAAVLCYTNTAIFDSTTGETRRLQHERRRNRMRTGGAEELLRSAVFFATSTVMARRTAIPAHGADGRLPNISDWVLWVDIAQHGAIGAVPEVLAKYRLHANNITKRGDAILADQLLAVAVVESRYLQYVGRMHAVRAETLWFHAVRYLALGDVPRAELAFRGAFRESFRMYSVPFTWRLGIWTLLRLALLRHALPLYRRVAALAARRGAIGRRLA